MRSMTEATCLQEPEVSSNSIALRAEGLSKSYGRFKAVDNLTIEVRRGEIFGFLGPNGAGKTTSISMICGLLEPDAGRVSIEGSLVRAGDMETRTAVGVCPQNIVLWEMLTCLEQLVFIGRMYGVPHRMAKERGQSLLGAMGLAEKRHKLAKTLSGGMLRRLNLAMALVHDPKILVLDEPEAGLDPQSRVMVRDYIKSLAKQKTIILTTHNMDEADRLADRVAIIDRGRLLTVDTPEALKHSLGGSDVLEIEIGGPGDKACGAKAVAEVAPDVSLAGETLVIKARGMTDLLPSILNQLSGAGFRPLDLRLRPTTLEDVFIALTGRGLRE